MNSTPGLPRRVLAGLAFSDHRDDTVRVATSAVDEQVLAQARWLARTCGAELCLLHAVEEPDLSMSGAAGTLHHLIAKTVERQFDRLELELKAVGVPARTVLRTGRAHDVLLSEAEQWGADVIVVGPHREGYSLVERMLHGSTARKLFRDSPASVWVTHPGQPVTPSRILAPVDLTSEVSSEIVHTAVELGQMARVPGALLHCLQYPELLAYHRGAGGDALSAYRAEVRARARARCQALLEAAGAPDWPVLLTDDTVPGALERALGQREADLAILGRCSATGLAGRVLGGTAELVLHTVPMNTWVLRPCCPDPGEG